MGAYGDGQHDDTEVIQKAINKSRHVYLPSGTYLITNTINITPYSHIKGASMQNTKINTSITDFVFKYHSRINTAAWAINDAALEIEEFSCNCQNFLQLNQWDLQESQWKLQGTILPIHLYHLGLNGKYLSLNDPNIDTENISSVAELAPYGIGLCLSSVFDSVIEECRINGFGMGIFLDGCDIDTIRDNRFTNNRSSY